MEPAKLKFKCRKCQQDIVGKMINVHGFSVTRHFHPSCHRCAACDKLIELGEKYAVEKEGAKCSACYASWKPQVVKSPRGGVKSKPSDARGVVWQMAQAIEAANPPPQERAPAREGAEGVRDGKMGVCGACKKPIFGVLVQIGENVDLHPECHCCKRCSRVFADGESFVRDGSQHTICDSCVTAEHEKKVAARAALPGEIQAGEARAMGRCGACSKDIFDQAATFQNILYHMQCWACAKCKRQLQKGDGCVREANAFLCENCC